MSNVSFDGVSGNPTAGAVTPGQAALMQALYQIQLQIQQITVSPKPTYSLDGVSYSWGEHFRNLVEMQAELRKQIQAECGAFEVVQLPNAWPGPFGAAG